ncbi:hypothetical protein HNQ50_000803 [Silvimonas terrae]|uniref:Uncharacterized protein n=1 Tax=Silvimonas terrae TaxID=300266 RepID=A0A840RCI1_9NEIS|nr:hypothetical protein [Silvimonas terrae]MBB5190093.1 hypothetical protein [Silvimonas terrae]
MNRPELIKSQSAGQIGNVVPAPAPTIQDALEGLHVEIGGLNGDLEELARALDPLAIGPSATFIENVDGAVPAQSSYSSMFLSIQGADQRVAHVRVVVRDLINSLQLRK